MLDNAKENSIITRGNLLVRGRDHPIAKTSRAWDTGALRACLRYEPDADFGAPFILFSAPSLVPVAYSTLTLTMSRCMA